MENSYSPEDHEQDDHQVDTEEGSGWTAYFQDFSNDNKKKIDDDEYLEEDIISCDYSICTSSSLLSDAASYAISHNPLKRLTFKKARTSQVINEDYSLEDTASSPLNSPKVGDLIKIKPHTDYLTESTRQRGILENYSEVNQKGKSLVDFDAKNECVDLKKRGLCLVPLSMLMNYHN